MLCLVKLIGKYYIMTTEKFEFIEPYLTLAQKAIAKYPEDRKASAVLTLLDLAQRQRHEEGHYVHEPAILAIAHMLDMSKIRVMEVASFFTMINLEPVGKFHIQLCGTHTLHVKRGRKNTFNN